jgi:hypothetical protein
VTKESSIRDLTPQLRPRTVSEDEIFQFFNSSRYHDAEGVCILSKTEFAGECAPFRTACIIEAIVTNFAASTLLGLDSCVALSHFHIEKGRTNPDDLSIVELSHLNVARDDDLPCTSYKVTRLIFHCFNAFYLRTT